MTPIRKYTDQKTSDAKTAWKSIKKELRTFLERPQYEAWFSDLRFVNFDNIAGSLVVSTSDTVKKSQLEDRYKSLIVEKADDVIGGVRNVTILLENEVNDILSGPGTDSPMFSAENIPDPRYTFDTFVVGDNSRFAYGAALAVAENAEKPNLTYSPLFVYGDSGLGKTHLMHAIWHYVKDHYPLLKVLYISSEMFTDEFVKASQTNTFTAFKNKYRNLDLLMIDDIQFIEEKTKTVEEVFHTYNTLYNMGKQLVFSSDRPPKDLNLEDRLKSRLSSGLPVNLQAPAFETKVAILRNKASLQNIPLTDGLLEVIDIIADRIKTNVREMEGALNRVAAFSTLNGEPISKAMAKSILKDIISAKDIQPTPDIIKKKVAKYYEIKPMDIDSKKRARSFSVPRQIAMFLTRELTDLSLPQIGDAFGGKDHTTVLYACEKVSKQMSIDEFYSNIVIELKEQILNHL
ncbi:MAG: chromosomal replication initiator protein DnaA [Clostridiales Family XIII bacterium]|jgi:chromosomal replication initiator protein|nr:chromosomal replication initiator protein DnaA [Clostridiales Family XIII bacterium]